MDTLSILDWALCLYLLREFFFLNFTAENCIVMSRILT